MQGWHKAQWQKSNKREMEVTGAWNSRDIEQWHEKRWLEATAKGNKDLFPALKYSEQNQLIKLYFIPWKDTFVKCIFCIQSILHAGSIFFLCVVPFYRSTCGTPLHVLEGRKIWFGTNAVLLSCLLRAPQNVTWPLSCVSLKWKLFPHVK